jgi:hypothetical protein
MSNERLTPENLFLPSPDSPAVPWSLWDTLIGFVLFALVMVGIGLLPLLLPDQDRFLSLYILFYQPLQFIPILAVLILRGATWADLGFQKATPNVLALGCGLLFAALFVNIINNLIMLALHVEVQAQQFTGVFEQLEQPIFLLITGILLAPLFEETVFRGFLFGGLRKRLGWIKAALISSALFGASHLSIAAFIPTFTLGFLFAFLYQRSNSIWPGIVLHTLINAVGLCAVYLASQYMDPLMPFAVILWR